MGILVRLRGILENEVAKMFNRMIGTVGPICFSYYNIIK